MAPFHIHKRADWGAVPPRVESLPLKVPIRMLMIMDTGTDGCNNVESCTKAVKDLQTCYMEEKGYEDIPWSFLVGGDGSVYEGRGWYCAPIKTNLKDKRQADYDGKSLDIAYIGTFQSPLPDDLLGTYPTYKAVTAADDLYALLHRKHIINIETCHMTDFTVDYEAFTVE